MALTHLLLAALGVALLLGLAGGVGLYVTRDPTSTRDSNPTRDQTGGRR